ncbi:hypothetical protein BDZ45DRAFT_751581 [Acephala macrosclerotiorum]|nr:hypothetical protein BDZ45DRAFT_751581 [Acephala macrosclerotiorum]
MENTKLTSIPVDLIGAVRHFTPKQAVPVRRLNILLFFAMNPETKVFFFCSIQVGQNMVEISYDGLVGIATGLRLADFPCEPWDNENSLVALAGDSARVMTMYRGEGGNRGILDAALVDQLRKVYAGTNACYRVVKSTGCVS